MKNTDLRAKARAIFGPAIAEPMPKQPNGAKALQERANARPIPTYKVGGVVKKNKPPQPTAAEREAERKRRESLTNTKVTQSEADTLGRAMRSEGPRYKDGGKIAPASPNKIPKTGKNIPISPPKKPKTPLSSDELERRYDAERRKMLNEASKAGFERSPGYKSGGKTKKDGLAVMIAIGSPMKGMKNMKRPVKKAVGGTATTPNTPAANTAARPYVGPGMSATTQGTDEERRAHNALAILQAKYSSATPNRDGSNTNTYTKDAAGNVIGVQTNKNFDRNQSTRDFNTVGRDFISKGVPMRAVVQAQGELRKLQMDNRSTPAQHQAAIQAILARMNSLVPKRAAKGGIIKKAKGGMACADGGAMMKPVKRAAGGAAKVRKGMMSPEGKIIDAMNKIRGK